MSSLSEADFQRLSPHALVGFASRCARRVQAYYNPRYNAPDVPVEAAIAVAEKWAANLAQVRLEDEIRAASQGANNAADREEG